MEVTFFLAGERHLGRLARLDPDLDWREFQRGERIWVLQAYLRLARAGFPVRLAAVPPAVGLVVFHAKHERALLAAGGGRGGAVLVGIRADNRQPLAADFEILQNGRFADGRRRFALPHWPQPGLVPRDPARGARLVRAAYKGFDANLHLDLRGAGWRDFLAARGVEWVVDSAAFAGAATDELPLDWPDYRTLDLVVAVRPPERSLWRSKPASKLVNAWLAGVPALLGPEVAYRELRRSPLDYLEVASRAEAEAAVDRLRADPALYRAMVANGRERGAERTAEAVLPLWAELLLEELPARAAARRL
ncbi:MAG TPA: glycosyltransferase, partial [Thermoanaerobaculia bacterium]|nr:glycosyltransferase [Thermoanaerobaculia bacterium]